MPIQSTPVTTQSSINLSDINIDTDLDMGSNSIIGYSTTTSMLNSFPVVKSLSTDDYLYKLSNKKTYQSCFDTEFYKTNSGTGTWVYEIFSTPITDIAKNHFRFSLNIKSHGQTRKLLFKVDGTMFYEYTLASFDDYTDLIVALDDTIPEQTTNFSVDLYHYRSTATGTQYTYINDFTINTYNKTPLLTI